MEDDSWKLSRIRMVEYQIEARGIHNPRVLDAMREIPRHLFVPPEFRESAYQDRPLPIGKGQTISQPYIVAMMTELLEIGPGDKVLEVGTGSGYQAAILAKLARFVVTIERLPEIASAAEKLFESLNISNVKVITGDGTEGYPPEAPYDAIIVTAATPDIPPPLTRQIADRGRLVAPVGSRDLQNLIRIRRHGDLIDRESYGGVVFVPLLGRYGWQG
jgi:protein-L-isoaspartate(D-aspartate) O-methyltransferase